ncbi:hypothetical protein D931_00346 [Enterococcus faecium 13.SD.W.09]|nr:hypothetical protein D931_00346 [Enterococcus faecium 13.SD.W.09]
MLQGRTASERTFFFWTKTLIIEKKLKEKRKNVCGYYSLEM